MATSESSARCPLCEHTEAVPLERISYGAIWSELQRRYAAEFPPDVIRRNTPPGEVTTLSECTACGLQYFAPLLAGGIDFYEALSTPNLKYADDRWEFRAARELIAGTDAVVDFGCGDGAFLRSLPQSQRRRVGVDHSAAAIRKLEAGGIEGYTWDFAELAAREPGQFDVGTAFHVAEHLPQLGGFMEAATSCLRPGGTLLIAVPNRERLYMPGIPVLDCPPHHMSRWQSEQFGELADRYGVTLVATHFERRTLPQLPQVVKDAVPLTRQAVKVLRARGRAYKFLRSTATPVAPVAATRPHPALLRRLLWGHSILAEFRTRSAAS